MTWIRRADPATEHRCDQPMREAVYRYPSMIIGGEGELVEHREQVPDGRLGDLWRCSCGALWRIGDVCDPCDRLGGGIPHAGGHAMGVIWRPATFWQRLRHLRTP